MAALHFGLFASVCHPEETEGSRFLCGRYYREKNLYSVNKPGYSSMPAQGGGAFIPETLLYNTNSMTNDSSSMSLVAIGIVRSPLKEPTYNRLDLREITAEIIIDESLTEALDGLEGFSHIIVLYWMHLAAREKKRLKTHPMGRQDVPPQGLFATRSPNRPNPIGKTTVRLLERRGNVLKVQGLDAIDGTSVIDIKPYMPGYDSAAGATTPDWVVREEG